MKYFLVIAFFSEALLSFDKINVYSYINATNMIGIIILVIFNFFIFKKIDLNEKNKIVIIIFLTLLVVINLYTRNNDYILLDNIFLIFYLLSNITIYILCLYLIVYFFKRYTIKYVPIIGMSLILIYSSYIYSNPYDVYNLYVSKKILKKLYIKSGYILHYGYLLSLKDNNCTVKNEVYKINEVFKNMNQSEIKKYQKNKKLFYDKGE